MMLIEQFKNLNKMLQDFSISEVLSSFNREIIKMQFPNLQHAYQLMINILMLTFKEPKREF